MAKESMKRPTYDGCACLLYDYMVSQGLTEEIIMRRMGLNEEQKEMSGKEVYNRAPWCPVSLWIQEPASIPRRYILGLCRAVNAPIEAIFIRSRILNNMPFELCGNSEKQRLENIPSNKLVIELKRRGYKVYKEV